MGMESKSCTLKVKQWIVLIHSALHDPGCDRMDEGKDVQEKHTATLARCLH